MKDPVTKLGIVNPLRVDRVTRSLLPHIFVEPTEENSTKLTLPVPPGSAPDAVPRTLQLMLHIPVLHYVAVVTKRTRRGFTERCLLLLSDQAIYLFRAGNGSPKRTIALRHIKSVMVAVKDHWVLLVVPGEYDVVLRIEALCVGLAIQPDAPVSLGKDEDVARETKEFVNILSVLSSLKLGRALTVDRPEPTDPSSAVKGLADKARLQRPDDFQEASVKLSFVPNSDVLLARALAADTQGKPKTLRNMTFLEQPPTPRSPPPMAEAATSADAASKQPLPNEPSSPPPAARADGPAASATRQLSTSPESPAPPPKVEGDEPAAPPLTAVASTRSTSHPQPELQTASPGLGLGAAFSRPPFSGPTASAPIAEPPIPAALQAMPPLSHQSAASPAAAPAATGDIESERQQLRIQLRRVQDLQAHLERQQETQLGMQERLVLLERDQARRMAAFEAAMRAKAAAPSPGAPQIGAAPTSWGVGVRPNARESGSRVDGVAPGAQPVPPSPGDFLASWMVGAPTSTAAASTSQMSPIAAPPFSQPHLMPPLPTAGGPHYVPPPRADVVGSAVGVDVGALLDRILQPAPPHHLGPAAQVPYAAPPSFAPPVINDHPLLLASEPREPSMASPSVSPTPVGDATSTALTAITSTAPVSAPPVDPKTAVHEFEDTIRAKSVRRRIVLREYHMENLRRQLSGDAGTSMHDDAGTSFATTTTAAAPRSLLVIHSLQQQLLLLLRNHRADVACRAEAAAESDSGSDYTTDADRSDEDAGRRGSPLIRRDSLTLPQHQLQRRGAVKRQQQRKQPPTAGSPRMHMRLGRGDGFTADAGRGASAASSVADSRRGGADAVIAQMHRHYRRSLQAGQVLEGPRWEDLSAADRAAAASYWLEWSMSAGAGGMSLAMPPGSATPATM